MRPGDYRLRAQISFTRLWDMPVTVGEKTVLDLTLNKTVADKDVLKPKSSGPPACAASLYAPRRV